MVLVLVICIVALLCSSIYGIFFSSESDSGTNMKTVIAELNEEFMNKITDIQNSTEYDEFVIDSNNRADWKNVLAIYTAKVSNGKEKTELMTLDDKRVQILKDIFWDMNIISSNTEKIKKDITTTDENGNTKVENVERTVLHISISSKTVEEMIIKYNFSKEQKEQVDEFLKEEYASLWNSVIYGTSTGNQEIVQVAKQQIGNIGGQPYWSWYGFSSRVEWCACFVSWCAEQCGYIEAGIIPKFASVNQEGVPWFKTVGLWKDGVYTPKDGDIIFFDWEDDGTADHVGIVEKTENGIVYTIEGNTKGDMCKQNEYNIQSDVILGYGTPAY